MGRDLERDEREAAALADLTAEAEVDRLYVKVGELKARIKELEAERALLLGFARRVRSRSNMAVHSTIATIYDDVVEVLARFPD